MLPAIEDPEYDPLPSRPPLNSKFKGSTGLERPLSARPLYSKFRSTLSRQADLDCCQSDCSLLHYPIEKGCESGIIIAPMSVGCVECCPELSCPPAELTPQCTDQCVVIACTDPSHGEMSCHAGAENQLCEVSCDGSSDCPGFEEFLHCCTDYHAYLSEPKQYPADSQPSSLAWDASLNALLCACEEQSQNMQNSSAPQYRHQEHPVTFYEPSGGDSLSGESSSSGLASLESPQQPTARSHTPQRRADQYDLQRPLKCMWADCGASFTDISELVGHVNIQHLYTPSSNSSDLSSEVNGVGNSSNPLSCLWGDCHVYSPLESIATSSTASQLESAVGVLANHLLHDHLGIPQSAQAPSQYSGESYSDVVPPPSPTKTSLQSSAPLTPPSDPYHECSGSHVCRWKDCGQISKSCDDLTSHMTVEHVGSGKGQYSCFWEGCPRHGSNGFSSKQKIMRHLQSHTGHRPFQCQLCKQNFSEAATLQQHMRRHTQEKPFVCGVPGCGKAFAIAGALTIHKRTHNGDRPFKCTYCERGFSESSNLAKHLRTHTGVRPYICVEPNCGKSFARPDQLARHAKVHRKKIIAEAEVLDS